MSFISEYRRILKISEKPGGERNLFDFLIYRRLSTCMLMLIKDLPLTPNLITTFSIVWSFVAGYFLFHTNQYHMILLGVLFLNVSLIFDTLDGQFSRYKKMKSEFGAWYDGVSDCLKYIIIFLFLSIGLYYHPIYTNQWLVGASDYIIRHKELPLIMGTLITANFFLIYYIHVSRYKLKFNPENIVVLPTKNEKTFFIGIEATLYTIFTIFLLAHQIYALMILLTIFLPILWIYPFYLVYKKSKIMEVPKV